MSNNNSTNDSINGIRAKKISQLTSLPKSFYPTDDNSNEDILKNLYFVLGFNDNKIVSNYKMNFEELINLLISTGKLSSSSSIHLITYNLDHITTEAPNNFTGNTYELILIPDPGYNLPEELNIIGVASYIYNNETGYLYMIASNGVNNIIINAIATPLEYTFDIESTGIICEYENNSPYHINDTITINMHTIDSDNYDISDRNEIGLIGLDIVSFSKNNDKGSITVKINGNALNTELHVESKKIYYYYFGYSIKNDGILIYDSDGIPTGTGPNFETSLFNGRNVCPIPFEDGFDYGNGHDKIAEDDNVFLIIPKKYHIIDRNLFINDTNNTYSLQAGNSGFTIPIQTNSNNNLMIYNNILYKNVEYNVICISTTGKQGHQSFRFEGNIGNIPIRIKWNTLLENKHIKVGTTFDASSNNSIIVYYLNGSEERKTNGFTIEIENIDNINVGTYNNGIYTAPNEISDSMSVTFICKYKYNDNKPALEDRISVVIEKTGKDEGLQGIIWNVSENIELESLGTYIIDYQNTILGLYAGNETHIVQEPSLLEFEVVNGVGEINGYTYIAPRTKNNLTAIIKASYKNKEAELNIIINGIEFDFLDWPTDLPKAIYDDETLVIDKTLFKITDEEQGISELIEDENNILLASSLGTLTENYFMPVEVNEDTQVTLTISYNGFSVEKSITVKPSTIIPTITGAYWYIGQYEPSGYTNPLNDLIDISDLNDKTGWREIVGSFSSYKTNPLYNCPVTNTNRISFHDDAIYYIAIPSGFIFKNSIGDIVSINIHNTITIGNQQYNIYKFDSTIDGYDETFMYDIYYNDASIYYIYWGVTLPTSDINPEDNLSTMIENYLPYICYTPGWYPIGSSIINYTKIPLHLWISPDFATYDMNDTIISEPCQYILIPKDMGWCDESGNDCIDNTGNPTINTENFRIQKINEIQIQGIDYYIYNILSYDMTLSFHTSLYYKSNN